jgi:flagellar biosynthesis/type III secretory pathway chaperone
MANLHQIFYEQLSQELEIANTLHRLLCEERELLDPPNIEALSELQTLKLQQLTDLEASAQVRCAWLEEHHIPLDKHCCQHPLLQSKKNEDNELLAALWQQLADQFKENRRLTEILSVIVLTERKRTQSLMKILRGQKNSPNLYTRSGQTQGKSTGLGYAKA